MNGETHLKIKASWGPMLVRVWAGVLMGLLLTIVLLHAMPHEAAWVATAGGVIVGLLMIGRWIRQRCRRAAEQEVRPEPEAQSAE
ncbi:MAG: hypothetical protein AB1411_16520 [Nitrospirota bacterium]